MTETGSSSNGGVKVTIHYPHQKLFLVYTVLVEDETGTYISYETYESPDKAKRDSLWLREGSQIIQVRLTPTRTIQKYEPTEAQLLAKEIYKHEEKL